LPEWADKGSQHDQPCINKEFGHFSNAADIFFALCIEKPKPRFNPERMLSPSSK
jgi:hypothetical protein